MTLSRTSFEETVGWDWTGSTNGPYS